jgi:RsiW-degrading membrane proteinase PrsW (M82 family)
VNEVEVSYEGRRYSFEPGSTVRIGRSPDNDVVVSEPTVSRQHAHLGYGPEGWVFEGEGRAGTFLHGATVTRLVVRDAVELTLASPQGPLLRIEPVLPATRAATSDLDMGTAFAAPPPPSAGAEEPVAAQEPASPAWGPDDQEPALPWAPGAQAAAPPWGAAPSWGPGAQAPAAPPWGPPDAPGAAAPPGGPGAAQGEDAAPGAGSREELASAFQILVPIKSWLTDPGWRQGLRLLVIPYALLPLVFLALFTSSGNLTTPGWAYSLYVAPLWGIAFWWLIRPPAKSFGRQELLIAIGIVIWVMLWMSLVTININRHANPRSFADALVVGFNEEITKALPILVAALLLLKLRSVKLDVRMWMFLGTIAGLTFGVREASQYTTVAIEHIAAAAAAHSANEAVVGALSFAYRVFVDGFQHAIWAGVSAFFIGIAVNYPRRRVPLIIFGISIAAVLHAVNDWYLSNFTSPWPWILLQAFSLFLFLGYTMSAASIERKVRRTPLFRGESMIMDKFSETGEMPGA